jgi:hypothetical protein
MDHLWVRCGQGIFFWLLFAEKKGYETFFNQPCNEGTYKGFDTLASFTEKRYLREKLILLGGFV